MSFDEYAELLSDFGLTFNQAKVYLAVVQLGLASVSEVSRTAEVRREDIYRMLPKLQELGLMEKTLEKPIRIRALPVKEALSLLIKREEDTFEQRLSVLQAQKDALLMRINVHKTRPKLEESHFSLISQRDAVIRKGLTMTEAAERSIDIVTSKDQFLHFFASYTEPIKNALRRGVKFRIVLDAAEHDDSILRLVKKYDSPDASLHLNCVDEALSHYTVVDHREGLMATSVEPTALGRNPYLWTSDSNLIGLMTRSFESTWHTSVTKSSLETEDDPRKLVGALRSLKPTNHVLFLYRSSETKYRVLTDYIQAGLENHEAVVYIASEENPDQVREAVKRFGIEVEKHEKTGALSFLEYNQFYIRDKKFRAPTTINLIHKVHDEAIESGFLGCRAFGDMACFFKHNLVHELIGYERELRRVLDVPLIAVCAYNIDLLTKAENPVDLYNELLRTHSTVLFAGQDGKLGRIEVRQV